MLIKVLLIKESVYSMIVLLLIRQFSVILVFRYIIDPFLISFPCFYPMKTPETLWCSSVFTSFMTEVPII